ncbi:HamA C-terminal domain-containing protein [Roseateles noduli]|uniref:HamA C-terminal domain-containing protein n=1 Tax=Roseateles noduli TaxID=2052484 RepID=UPI003D64C2A2
MTEADEGAFEALLDPIEGLENVIKEVVADPQLRLPRLLFVRFHGEEPEVHALVELLTAQLVDYVVPLAKRKKANEHGSRSRTGGSTSAHGRLQLEARSLLIKFEKETKARYGELGELLSFVIAVHYLGAAQIGSKMALKTSSGMPVHGVDGLHAKANADGTVTFYLLESKLVPSAADASRDMVASIAEYRADRGRKLNELRLASDFSNLEVLQGEQREAAKSFFNDYVGDGSHLRRRDVHAGSLVFAEAAYGQRLPVDHSKPLDIHEENFQALYAGKHIRFKENLQRQAESKGLDLGHCEVFLVAVPDIDEIKRLFAELNPRP